MTQKELIINPTAIIGCRTLISSYFFISLRISLYNSSSIDSPQIILSPTLYNPLPRDFIKFLGFVLTYSSIAFSISCRLNFIIILIFNLVVLRRFELRLAEPKSDVLPLHHRTIIRRIFLIWTKSSLEIPFLFSFRFYIYTYNNFISIF